MPHLQAVTWVWPAGQFTAHVHMCIQFLRAITALERSEANYKYFARKDRFVLPTVHVQRFVPLKVGHAM